MCQYGIGSPLEAIHHITAMRDAVEYEMEVRAIAVTKQLQAWQRFEKGE